jgi:ABC-type lipopolysaccharide export system ATPase subunit
VRYLEIIFVLSQNRKYVFLDEPFTGLAPKLIEEVIKKILIKKREGSGILISDHYINYLLDITDSIYYISNEETTLIESNKGFKAELKRIGYLK